MKRSTAASEPLSIEPAAETVESAEPVHGLEVNPVGLLGSSSELHALAPHPMLPPGPANSVTTSIAQKELQRLGFYDPARAALKARGDSAFSQMVGVAESADESLFLNHATTHWGWDALTAQAAFKACDLDRSGGLSRHEYLLLIAALVHYGEGEPPLISGTLNDLRIRTIFMRYYLKWDAPADEFAAGCTPDAFDVQLSERARRAFVRDLCGGATHVESILTALGWDDGAPLSVEVFKRAQPAISGANLSAFELLPPPTAASVPSANERRDRLVLDWKSMQRPRYNPRKRPWPRVEHPSKRPDHSSSSLQADPADEALSSTEGEESGMAPDPPHLAAMASVIVGSRALNSALELAPSLRAPAGSDWRGPLAVGPSCEAYNFAVHIVQKAQWLASEAQLRLRTLERPPADSDGRTEHERMQAAFEATTDDADWLPGGEALRVLCGTSDLTHIATQVGALSAEVRRITMAQPTLIHVAPPAKIFGDIHGQLRDVLELCSSYGFPSHRACGDVESVAYIFNGDFVDRGAHQLEVVVLLLALKALYPERIVLLRGNHEFREQNVAMGPAGFATALQHRFAPLGDAAADVSKRVFASVHSVFDWLPIGALIGGVALTLHGGIGDGDWGLEQLASGVPRPLFTLRDAPLMVAQALWSDPSDSDAQMAWGVHHNADRDPNLNYLQVMKRFGPDVTEAFCAREGIQLIIRSHQYVEEGVKFMHSGRLVTVFSARNYLRAAKNDGALLLIAIDGHGHYRVRAKRLLHRP